jgi:peptidyl-prolyl cis-trans isomerase D
VGPRPGRADPAKAKEQYALVWGDAEAQAYYAALKSKFKATVNESALARARARRAHRPEPRDASRARCRGSLATIVRSWWL